MVWRDFLVPSAEAGNVAGMDQTAECLRLMVSGNKISEIEEALQRARDTSGDDAEVQVHELNDNDIEDEEDEEDGPEVPPPPIESPEDRISESELNAGMDNDISTAGEE